MLLALEKKNKACGVKNNLAVWNSGTNGTATRDQGQSQQNRDCPGRTGTVGAYGYSSDQTKIQTSLYACALSSHAQYTGNNLATYNVAIAS